jgi:hypothetical protein
MVMTKTRINSQLCAELDAEWRASYPQKPAKPQPPVMQDADEGWLDWQKRHGKGR